MIYNDNTLRLRAATHFAPSLFSGRMSFMPRVKYIDDQVEVSTLLIRTEAVHVSHPFGTRVAATRSEVQGVSRSRHCKRLAQPLSLHHSGNHLNVFVFFNVSLGHVSDLLLDDFLPP